MNNTADITRIAAPAIKLSMPPPMAAVPKIVNPKRNQKSAQPEAFVVPFMKTSVENT